MSDSESNFIDIDFVRSKRFPILERLGMMPAPGKGGRNLAADIGKLQELYDVGVLISLVEDRELAKLGIEQLADVCEQSKIKLIRFPIVDCSTPKAQSDYVNLIGKIESELRDERTVAIHCHAGLGRTGMTAACAITAVSKGKILGEEAIETVRNVRPGTIETPEQEQYVFEFAKTVGFED